MKFEKHHNSKCREEAVLKVVSLPTTTQDVLESLNSQHKRDKLECRQCFLNFGKFKIPGTSGASS